MPDTLRIAIVASSRYPIAQPFAGGLEAHVWHLTRALTLAGHEVTLFAGAGSDLPVDSDRLRGELFEPSAAARSDVSMPQLEALQDHHAYLSLMLSFTNNPGDYDGMDGDWSLWADARHSSSRPFNSTATEMIHDAGFDAREIITGPVLVIR